VKTALKDVDGVCGVEATYEPPEAVVRFAPATTSIEALTQADEERRLSFSTQILLVTVAEIQLLSTIACPECGTETEVEMPTESCQFFWECPACGTSLRPEPPATAASSAPMVACRVRPCRPPAVPGAGPRNRVSGAQHGLYNTASVPPSPSKTDRTPSVLPGLPTADAPDVGGPNTDSRGVFSSTASLTRGCPRNAPGEPRVSLCSPSATLRPLLPCPSFCAGT
jgi:hypothetical protein